MGNRRLNIAGRGLAAALVVAGCGSAKVTGADLAAPPDGDGTDSFVLDAGTAGEAADPTVADAVAGIEAGDPELAPPSGRTSAAAFAGTLNAASFAAGQTHSSSALAVAAGIIVVANPDSDSLTVVDEATLEVVAEIAVGDDPRTVALTGDGRYAVVVNRGDQTVSVVDVTAGRELYFLAVGALPYGVALVGARAYVTEMARGDLAVLDLSQRAVVARLPVGDSPAGIAACLRPRCALPGGDALLVTHFYSGQVTVVDRSALAVTARIATGADPNLSQFVAVARDGARIYLPQTRSNADNPNRQFDTTVFPVVNVVDLAPAGGGGPRLLNADRITLDTADRPVGMPFAVDQSPDGRTLWVANAASDDLSVIDLETLRKLAHLEVGAHPRALVLSADGTRAYVSETLDGTLAVIATAAGTVERRLPLTKLPLAPAMLLGKKLFHSSQRTDLAKDQWMACATCHFDGFTDRRTWRSFPDGPRNTTALFNLKDTLPLHWSGDLNELQDVEATVRFIQAGTGLAPAPRIDTLGDALTGVSADLDALAAFISEIPAPRSPFQDDPAAIARGQALFTRLGCGTCHADERLTDRQRHDVGTGDPAVERNGHGRGTSFDTPSLRALWLTPPYLHDGSAATLDDVLTRGPAHDVGAATDAAGRADLVAFLRSL